VVPISDYYIIAGIVYQAPDLVSVINARLVRFSANRLSTKHGQHFTGVFRASELSSESL